MKNDLKKKHMNILTAKYNDQRIYNLFSTICYDMPKEFITAAGAAAAAQQPQQRPGRTRGQERGGQGGKMGEQELDVGLMSSRKWV